MRPLSWQTIGTAGLAFFVCAVVADSRHLHLWFGGQGLPHSASMASGIAAFAGFLTVAVCIGLVIATRMQDVRDAVAHTLLASLVAILLLPLSPTALVTWWNPEFGINPWVQPFIVAMRALPWIVGATLVASLTTALTSRRTVPQGA